jgi:hypothetical protein
MTDIFHNQDIGIVPHIKYVSGFIDENDDDFQLIQLPPIQRNAVWNTYHFETLWDSILRGFPIGSFLLSERKADSKARGMLSTDLLVSSERQGYFLLDGQQRTRAILLGFAPDPDSRLWIDLDPKLTFENTEYNDRKFLLRLITRYQPWGMEVKNPKEKLNADVKFQARLSLYGKTIRYDYDIPIDTGATRSETSYSWPVKSRLPVPLDSLINLCGGFSGKFVEPEWVDVLRFVPEKFGKDAISSPPAHFTNIIYALRNLLDTTNRNSVRSLVFLKQNDLFDFSEKSDESQAPIEVLFRRINAGGTPLIGEEMAYSLLKSSFDEAYNLVSKIVNDPEVGYLFSSTGIVMAASRLARYNLGKNDRSLPDVTTFRKWIGDRSENGSSPFLNELEGLIRIDNEKEGAKSKFHSVLQRFCKLVLYRGDTYPADHGLPKKLLLSIRPTIIHPVLIWLSQTEGKADDEASRDNILRYLVFSYLGIKEYDKASRIAIEELRWGPLIFPDRDIYSKWISEKGLDVYRIPTITSFNNTLSGPVTGFLRRDSELFGSETDPFVGFRRSFWKSKGILLWFQRRFHSSWFKGYNPMSNDAFDTPYDYDHLVPYSHLINSGPPIETGSMDGEEKRQFIDARSRYIGSIGNLRAWPDWANRSDSNHCQTRKLRMVNARMEADEDAKELGLYSADEFLRASYINPDDIGYWHDAGGSPRMWNEKRRIAWQHAVERRVMFLYREFYQTFGFSAWDEVCT